MPFTGLELTKQARLAGQQVSRSACCHLPRDGIVGMYHQAQLFTSVLGIKLAGDISNSNRNIKLLIDTSVYLNTFLLHLFVSAQEPF